MVKRIPHPGAPRPFRSRLLPIALLAVLLASACAGPATGPQGAAVPGEWRSFEGAGSATGHRQVLPMGPDRKVSIASFSGSLVLVGERRMGEGFRLDLVAATDSRKGGTGWSVWTDTRGDQVFSEVRGAPIGTGSRIAGTLVGGTGRYAGVTGEYELEWKYVVESEDGTVQGRITSLRGRFRQEGPPASPERKVFRGREGSPRDPA